LIWAATKKNTASKGRFSYYESFEYECLSYFLIQAATKKTMLAWMNHVFKIQSTTGLGASIEKKIAGARCFLHRAKFFQQKKIQQQFGLKMKTQIAYTWNLEYK
jgi:hypothetical protein